ncbi:MAG: hypothetical protein AAGH90_07930 [Pseudomonadota bacterium]
MSWLRTLLIFFMAMTLFGLALKLATGFYEFMFGAFQGSPFLPIFRLFSESFHHTMSVLIAGFAISILAKEEREPTQVVIEHTNFGIALFVFGGIVLVMGVLNLLNLLAFIGSFRSFSSAQFTATILANASAEVGSTTLFGLILIFAGRFLSRNSALSKIDVEETF